MNQRIRLGVHRRDRHLPTGRTVRRQCRHPQRHGCDDLEGRPHRRGGQGLGRAEGVRRPRNPPGILGRAGRGAGRVHRSLTRTRRSPAGGLDCGGGLPERVDHRLRFGRELRPHRAPGAEYGSRSTRYRAKSTRACSGPSWTAAGACWATPRLWRGWKSTRSAEISSLGRVRDELDVEYIQLWPLKRSGN